MKPHDPQFIALSSICPSDIRRFWAKVTKTKCCWQWTAKAVAGNSVKYGLFHLSNGRQVTAHRLSWVLAYGDLPSLCVLHSCDNGRCVNPSHLRLGTRTENNQDCARKGRTARGVKNGSYTKPDTRRRGEANGQAQLSQNDVLLIRAQRRQGRTLKSIAADFGVHLSTIHLIAAQKKWKHVA